MTPVLLRNGPSTKEIRMTNDERSRTGHGAFGVTPDGALYVIRAWAVFQNTGRPSSLSRRSAFSLLELLAVVAIIGVVAAVILPRVSVGHDEGKKAACYVFKGDIEVRAELWMHNTGSWPAGDLSDIGADLNYFPEGLPVCPVDGTAYTIGTATGRVIGHVH